MYNEKELTKTKSKERKEKRSNESKGITLIVLVITIIVLLILAGVVIATLTGDNGILTNANKATTNNGVAAMEEKIRLEVENAVLEAKNDETQGKGFYTEGEQQITALEYRLKQALDLTTLNNTAKEIDSKMVIKDGGSKSGKDIKRVVTYNEDVENEKTMIVDITTGGITTAMYAGKNPILDSESFVGKYADIEGDGTVDGIIFADLAIGGSGQWTNANGAYTIPTETGLKEYYVSEANYSKDTNFGTKDVIAPINGTSGKDRFYIMALSNATSSNMKWAPATGTDYGTIGEVDFGKGKANTTTLMGKSALTASDSGTLWAQIGTKVSQGWFIPSRGEWAAFAGILGITGLNYSSTYGISSRYWSSSQYSTDKAWYTHFYYGYMNNDDTVIGPGSVRMATTF